MKIVYCIQQTFNSGGMERVLFNKANWLVANGYDVTFITTEQKGRQSFFWLDERICQIDLGINYWDNARRRGIKKLCYYLYNKYLHNKRLKSVIQKLSPDVIVSMFGHDMSIIPYIKISCLKVLECHFTHSRIMVSPRSGFKGLWDTWNFREIKRDIDKFDHFVVLSEFDRMAWGNKANTRVIPNYVSFDVDRVSNLKAKKAIAIGRLVEEKGFDRLISIWRYVHELCPDWSLEILGDGPMKEQLNRMVYSQGLEDSVNILPPVLNIQKKYLESSMLLSTSHSEGFGMTVLEGMACGLPCVCYDVPYGFRTIINDKEDGFLVEDGDVSTFIDRFCLLAKNDDIRQKMGLKAKQKSKCFSEDAIMKQWVELFNGYKHHN